VQLTIPTVFWLISFLSPKEILAVVSPAPCPTPAPGADLKELIDFAKVDSLLGIQFVNVTDVPIHQVETKAHHLEKEEAEHRNCTPMRAVTKNTGP
jgi:hypothetical protein